MMPPASKSGSGSTCKTKRARRGHCAMRGARGFWLKAALVVLLVSATAPQTQTAYAQPSSDEPVVELTVSEADSILATIDDLEVRLWEAQALARQDSLYYEERLALQERAYEEILSAYKADRPGWLERLVKQPVVWLALGMWVGVQAN